jgi:predicted CoA-substrate-specific enzyme activase
MITVGIDMGAKNIKVVVARNGESIGQSLLQLETDVDRYTSARQALGTALENAGVQEGEVNTIVATGAGKKVVTFAKKEFTVVACNAKGIVKIFPSVRVVIDVGAEEARCVRLDETGRVIEFAINEKCAAGAGAFMESMARAMEVSIEEFARISLTSTRTIPINAQCAIFAESEVVSLVHGETDRADISKAVNDAMASRVGAMSQRVTTYKDIALIGGVAKSIGFVESLKAFLKEDLLIPKEPDFVTAFGAALLGMETGEGSKEV